MLIILFTDEEPPNQKQISECIKEEIEYEIPKSVNEIGISYVTMKDFKFDSENQQAQVV